MPGSIYIEVEENDNCEYMPMLLYETQRDAVPIARVMLSEPDRPQGVCQVTGWSSEGDGSPCDAMYVPVSDSGLAVVHLVYGGDWGVRLKPVDSDEGWNITSPDQWGEPYLVLTDRADILLDSENGQG